MSEKANETFWFTPLLNWDEARLTNKGVPRCYWGYILANGPPGTDTHDGLGAIYDSREVFVEVTRDTKNTMGVTVVDGRDLETIREWIGGRDWTEDQEAEWVQIMEQAEWKESTRSY